MKSFISTPVRSTQIVADALKNGPMMARPVVICLCSLTLSAAAWADSGGSDWSTSYSFPSASKHQTNMSQADLIAKRESGYYDGLGKSVTYNISTNTIGTMNTMTATIDGDNNTVASDSLSSGSLDASVAIQSLSSSTISQDKSH
jgi:hypothetical protein